MAGLKLTNIKKAYGPVEVIHGVNLEIRQGEFVVFVGPSGCGKSTLLRMIAGLEEISGGTLEIDGAVVNHVPPSKRGIAMVFQSYALYPHMTVYENMAFGMRIAKESSEEIDRRVRMASSILQLDPYLDRLPKALSGGQRQRVAIGRAICRNPKVFLFDEPLSNLDAALRVATRIEIAKLSESMPDTTMIYVTHDQVEAMTLADRIVVLSAGYIEQVGSPMELYNNPQNLFVAKFIGSPAMNIVPVTIEEPGVNTVVKLPDGHRVTLPIPTDTSQKGKSASFGVRPEDMTFTEGEDYLIEGPVQFSEKLGEVTLLYVAGFDSAALEGDADDSLIVKVPGVVDTERNARYRFTADPGVLHLFDADGKAFGKQVYREAAE